MDGYLITKTIVNEAGQPEIWLHDGSRRATPDELAFLRRAVEQSNAVYAWRQAAAQADDLGPLLKFAWNPDLQDFEVLQHDGARRVPMEELATLRDQIMARRRGPQPSPFTVGGS